VIGWDRILYGASLSAVFAVGGLAALGTRRVAVLVTAGMSALLAPIGWNAVLRATHAGEFFTDAPVAVFPISWQDTGSGVVTVALASVLLGFGPLGSAPARSAVLVALGAGLAALFVDVYLY
jgi:hypothetical protein